MIAHIDNNILHITHHTSSPFVSRMQLRPQYPQVSGRKKSMCVTRKARQMLFAETEPIDMAISYDEYEEFLRGVSYDVIWNRQCVRVQREREARYQKAFDNVVELCRYQDFVRETFGEHDREIPKLTRDVQTAFLNWESMYECSLYG